VYISSASKNSSQSIFDGKLAMKDGELICAFDGKKMDLSTISNFKIMRLEDKVLKLSKDAQNEAKKQAKKNNGQKNTPSSAGEGKAKAKPRRVEVQLQIGGHLSFSSDEEDNTPETEN